MNKMNIGVAGKFLSGRSRAAELVHRFVKAQSEPTIVVDFNGVEWVSQSFISELLVKLKERGVEFQDIQFVGVKNQEIEARIKHEIERLSRLI